MIVRLATFTPMTPEVAAEARRNLLERFKPALASQPGFLAGYWGEAADGQQVSITVWESEEALHRGGAAANATPLLPGQDPEKIPSPERTELFTLIAQA